MKTKQVPIPIFTINNLIEEKMAKNMIVWTYSWLSSFKEGHVICGGNCETVGNLE